MVVNNKLLATGTIELMVGMEATVEVLNREGWLTLVAACLEESIFADFVLAPYRLACGWPSRDAASKHGRCLGECHALQASQSGVHEIFISPTLAERLEVAGVVCHELAHVVAGVAAQHGTDYLRVCRHIGLTRGEARSIMPGIALNRQLKKIVSGLPSYPHRPLSPCRRKPARSSGNVRLLCGLCGCRIYTSRHWLRRVGLPRCGCGGVVGRVD